ncbi:MAG: heme lyase CcmF/NrfE family subunit [Syntrophothermus sp.]
MAGSIVLSLALFFSIASMVTYVLAYRGKEKSLSYARLSYHVMSMLIIVASTILWYYILNHQYQYKYVYSYSSNELSFGFLFSTFWGGQEGSFMLWLLFTSIVGIVLQSYTSKLGDLEPRVMMVYTLATTFLLIMVSPLFKNPFEMLWAEPIFISLKDINPAMLNLPVLQSFAFADPASNENFVKVSAELNNALNAAGYSINQLVVDGKGLNPQLLNFWMQIHPPILFLGFSMATVPFAFAVAALIKNDYKNWIRQSFPWVLAGTGILGLGIMLGGYWAYEMLGWGGYWAWDPVENSSLVPWLVGAAAIHTMIVQKKTQNDQSVGKFAKTNLILCIMIYVLVLYSTFLTRSGVLGDASVHSFVDPGQLVYAFLVLFISTFTILGFGMLLYRWGSLTSLTSKEDGLLSRDFALFTGSAVLMASAIIVLVGTSAPLLGKAVDTVFYNEMHVPLAIIIGLLNGLSLYLKWKDTKKEDLIKKIFPSAAATLVLTILIAVIAGLADIMLLLLVLSASFALVVNAQIAYQIIRGNKKMLGAYVAHIGIAIFILGVVGSAGLSQEAPLTLVKGKPVKHFGYEFTFTGVKQLPNENKYAFHIDITKDGKTYNAAPIMYISDFNNGLMREPDILSMISKDIYISPMGYEEPGATTGANLQLQKGTPQEIEGVKLTFNDFNFGPEARTAMQDGKDFEIGVNLTAEYAGKKEGVIVALKNKNKQTTFTSFDLKDADVKIQLLNLNPAGSVEVNVAKLDGQQTESVKEEVLSVNASIKPFISFVWIGVLVTVIGFFIAMFRRLKEAYRQ